MDGVTFERVTCPYCGEWIELPVDGSAGEQSYIEDCSVCCRPIEVRQTLRGGDWQLEVCRDDN